MMRSRTSPNRYLVNQGTDELGLKNVTERNPIQEAQEGLQRGVDQWSILGVFLTHSRRERRHTQGYPDNLRLYFLLEYINSYHDKLAKLENLRELVAHTARKGLNFSILSMECIACFCDVQSSTCPSGVWL